FLHGHHEIRMLKGQRLRRLGDCRRFARGKESHAVALGFRENLFRKTRKWTIVVRKNTNFLVHRIHRRNRNASPPGRQSPKGLIDGKRNQP
ncbi:MAG: hypothetical protein II381_02135, partial [Victivallales bacterium]|nr:hypothetical protein [Victivallales bacterium]